MRRAYLAAHRDYLARRDEAAGAAGVDPLPPGTQSAGGMPTGSSACTRGRARACRTAANPLGREGAEAAGAWWDVGLCVGSGTR